MLCVKLSLSSSEVSCKLIRLETIALGLACVALEWVRLQSETQEAVRAKWRSSEEPPSCHLE